MSDGQSWVVLKTRELNRVVDLVKGCLSRLNLMSLGS
jgi:hypothetical protein